MDAYKLVLVAFGGIVLMSNLIQVLIALYHNRYQPFKCKQPIVLLVGVLAAALGWIGNLQQNGIINQISIFQNCSVWTVFVQYCQIILYCCQKTITNWLSILHHSRCCFHPSSLLWYLGIIIPWQILDSTANSVGIEFSGCSLQFP